MGALIAAVAMLAATSTLLAGSGAVPTVAELPEAPACAAGTTEMPLTFDPTVAWLAQTVRVCAKEIGSGRLSSTQLTVANAGPAVWVLDGHPQQDRGIDLTSAAAAQVFREVDARASRTLAVAPGDSVQVYAAPATFRIRLDFGAWARWEIASRLVEVTAEKAKARLEQRHPRLNALVTCGVTGWGLGRTLAGEAPEDVAAAIDAVVEQASAAGECVTAMDGAAKAERAAPLSRITLPDLHARAVRVSPAVRQAEAWWVTALRGVGRYVAAL